MAIAKTWEEAENILKKEKLISKINYYSVLKKLSEGNKNAKN